MLYIIVLQESIRTFYLSKGKEFSGKEVTQADYIRGILGVTGWESLLSSHEKQIMLELTRQLQWGKIKL